jgi:O-antigen/teichoic acid export membrane protein
MRVVVFVASVCAALYAILSSIGDLRSHLPLYLACHAVLCVLMVVTWRSVARGGAAAFRAMLVAAVTFRLIASIAAPSLSDDV